MAEEIPTKLAEGEDPEKVDEPVSLVITNGGDIEVPNHAENSSSASHAGVDEKPVATEASGSLPVNLPQEASSISIENCGDPSVENSESVGKITTPTPTTDSSISDAPPIQDVHADNSQAEVTHSGSEIASSNDGQVGLVNSSSPENSPTPISPEPATPSNSDAAVVNTTEADSELPDQYADWIANDEAPCYNDPLDQYSDYLGGPSFDEVSLEGASFAESDTSSVKEHKKKSRVMGGLKNIASGGAKIVIGTKDIMLGTGKGSLSATKKGVVGVKNATVLMAHATYDSVGDVAQTTGKVVTGTGHAIKTGSVAVGQGVVRAGEAVVDGTKAGAAAVGHGVVKAGGAVVDGTVAVGHGVIKAGEAVVDGTKAGAVAVGHGVVRAGEAVVDGTVAVGHGVIKAGEVVVDGTKAGALAVGHGVAKAGGAVVDGTKAVGHGVVKAGEVVVDGTKAGALAVGHGVVKAGEAVVDGTKATAGFVADTTVKAAVGVRDVTVSAAEGIKDTTVTFAKASASAVTDVCTTTKDGVQAVGHGIENAAHSVADHAQKGMVDALTIGLKIVDPNVQVVHKAIAAKAPEQITES